SELVQILNELFARFDRLAEEYHQLRIKILGDCYYCISGAPEEREDHAILSVHMGLSMVEAIKYVREKTGSPVDMRVGIHTGAVLAGVLGQRQWHYDVYSKDVILANQMESSGMPGRVHVSNVTHDCLNGAFEVEKANGEKREEALRQAGLTTYFIIKVIKPLKQGGQEETNGDISQLLDPEVSDNNVLSRENSLNDPMSSNPPEKAQTNRERQSHSHRKRLFADLVDREGQRDALKDYVPRLVGLGFKRGSFENQFAQQRSEPEPALVVTALGPVLAFVGASVAQIPAVVYKFWSFLKKRPIAKAFLYFAVLLFMSALTLGDMVLSCFKRMPEVDDSLLARNCSPPSREEVYFPVGDNWSPAGPTSETRDDQQSCQHPGFFTDSGVLVFIGIVAVVDLGYDLMQFSSFSEGFSAYVKEPWKLTEELQSSLAAIEAGLMLILLARQWEKTGRVLFVWALGLTEQRERASAIRRHNQVLVYNILPPHVASHFMQRGRIRHSQLYSQSYARVGVMFASMPNFSEESVNNQGLECLRFLNEVISDFDALLEHTEFKEISKIKTIGSTYMAASGLAPAVLYRHRSKTRKSTASPLSATTEDRQKPREKKSRREALRTKWAHLALLVEFAFKMREALKAINEQSFNNFILKMGINHGPITAGVIGARKPHYDIWGNTVNVASRMESTGRAGFIQVTEETKRILANFGYVFETRGLVSVKGKGQLMTYYLVGKGDLPNDDDDDGDDLADLDDDDDDDDDDQRTTAPHSPMPISVASDRKLSAIPTET
ncbi:unnamed protein product, partial [Notodromas monacha]